MIEHLSVYYKKPNPTLWYIERRHSTLNMTANIAKWGENINNSYLVSDFYTLITEFKAANCGGPQSDSMFNRERTWHNEPTGWDDEVSKEYREDPFQNSWGVFTLWSTLDKCPSPQTYIESGERLDVTPCQVQRKYGELNTLAATNTGKLHTQLIVECSCDATCATLE
jgi:hypothetical protein